jgi:hypothetical protein
VALATQPPFTWSTNAGSGGSIDSTGLFTASSTAGSYTVTATSGGVSGNASVTVTALVPDFSLSVSPTSQSVRRGSSVSYTVTVGAVNGFTGSVSLSLTGGPSGATVTWSANPTTPGNVTMTIKTLPGTSTRNYSLTVTGTSGSLSHTASASLKVTK